MHGEESKDNFVIPPNVRIIMFCYSGRTLYVCPKFDKFIWSIFLDENSVSDYPTFLRSISGYSSIRDHFCVYEEGDTIKDMVFTSDETFRDGLFTLPVMGAVHDAEKNNVYVSSSDIFTDVLDSIENVKRVVVDKKKTAHAIRNKNSPGVIFSSHKSFLYPTSLSKILKNYLSLNEGCTLLLLTCRESREHQGGRISRGKRIKSILG